MSTIVTPFSRRHVFGYLVLVLSLVATAFIAFGLWVHHMFATGIPQIAEAYFTAASMMIAIPSGAQIFCWIAKLATGKVVLRTPLWWVLGFFFTFVMGDMMGIFVASVPVDLQVHDTYFVVAHFHYVLIGGAVFPFRRPYVLVSQSHGTHAQREARPDQLLAFLRRLQRHILPMHLVGLRGMPQRVYTYHANMGWMLPNQIESLGYILLFVSVLLFIWNVFRSLRTGALSGSNPWGARGRWIGPRTHRPRRTAFCICPR